MDGHEEVVVKLVESWQCASEEAHVLRQLHHVPHVAQLLVVINCTLPNSTVCSGLVMPYYCLSTDAHGMPHPHMCAQFSWYPMNALFLNCSFMGGVQKLPYRHL
jgi:hypothetical protein